MGETSITHRVLLALVLCYSETQTIPAKQVPVQMTAMNRGNRADAGQIALQMI